MYNLPSFKEQDASMIIEFMQQHPFVMVIGVDTEHKPVATQVPVLIKERNGELFLQGHIMKQTDHHKAFEQNPQVLAVFTGPSTYISASLYENKLQGSTWNYQSVHVKGRLNFLDEQGLLQLLDELTSHFENDPASPSLYKNLPEEYVFKLSKAIVAFDIQVTGIEHVFKLSQNHDQKDFENIVEHLAKGNADQQYIADEMNKISGKLFGQNS